MNSLEKKSDVELNDLFLELQKEKRDKLNFVDNSKDHQKSYISQFDKFSNQIDYMNKFFSSNGNFYQVEEGIIFKILSISHNGGGAPFSSQTNHHPFIRLNGEFIYRTINGGDDYYQTPFPFFLPEGIHSLEINYQNEWGNTTSTAGTIYGLEFKLTTP